MRNIINISKKEFADFIGNPSIIVIVIVYLLVVLASVLNINDTLQGSSDQYNISANILQSLIRTLTIYGSIIGIIIGYSSILCEKQNNAINTIIVKPLYRDTIVNGKLISCAAVMLCISSLATLIFISSIFILCNQSIIQVIIVIWDKILVVYTLSFLYLLFFLSLSMLMSILIKKQSISFLLCIILVFVFNNIIPGIGVAGNLAIIFDSDRQLITYIISGTSLDWVFINLVGYGFYDPAKNIIDVLSSCWFDVIKFIYLPLITIILCYIAFIRRDIV